MNTSYGAGPVVGSTWTAQIALAPSNPSMDPWNSSKSREMRGIILHEAVIELFENHLEGEDEIE